MSSRELAVLKANRSFYEAFAQRDISFMDKVWSTRMAVTCLHPGWGLLVGREVVMDSWSSILGGARAPEISCHGETAYVLGDAAYVTCYELVDGNVLAATNIFVRENGDWRLVHHQAGESRPLQSTPEPATPTMQ